MPARPFSPSHEPTDAAAVGAWWASSDEPASRDDRKAPDLSVFFGYSSAHLVKFIHGHLASSTPLDGGVYDGIYARMFPETTMRYCEVALPLRSVDGPIELSKVFDLLPRVDPTVDNTDDVYLDASQPTIHDRRLVSVVTSLSTEHRELFVQPED